MKKFLLFALFLTLSACGFHLRGINDVALQNLYIQDSGAPSITRDIKRAIKSGGAKLVESPEQAQVSLELMSENSEKRILSLSSTGRVREYELLYNVVFRVRETGQELWSEPQTVQQRRDFTYNDNQVLAKDNEEKRLNNDMRTDAIREIIRRVNSLSKNKSAPEKPAE
jgi:LPS-assembly lipoprotein